MVKRCNMSDRHRMAYDAGRLKQIVAIEKELLKQVKSGQVPKARVAEPTKEIH